MWISVIVLLRHQIYVYFKRMTTDELNKMQDFSENDVIFAPVEEIRNIERVIDNLESVQRMLLKIAEGMKEIVN